MSAVDTHGASKILLVEDDPAFTAGLQRVLEARGYVVRAVDRSEQTPAAIADFEPDIVLLDVMMPGMDGWQLLARLRQDPETRSLPIIMLTAAASDASKIRGFELGVDDYVTKPFNVQELQCRIEAILRRTRASTGRSPSFIPVIGTESKLQLIPDHEVYYVSGVRNFTHVHTADARFLSRSSLKAIEERDIEGLFRVHRSFIVNLRHVRGCGWKDRSSYRLWLGDSQGTEIPVSRPLVTEVQRLLDVRDRAE